MLDISPQISDASVQERIQPESSGFVKKGESGDPGPIGAFGRLLAGLLRKNQSSQPREAESSVLPEASAGSNNDKKAKAVLAGFRTREPVKNREKEELVSSRKPLRPEKPVKKTDREELSLVETAAAAKRAGAAEVTNTAGVAAAGDTAEAVDPADALNAADLTDTADLAAAPEAGFRAAAEKEAGSGLAGKKPEKTNADVSPEKAQFSPVFSGKKGTEEARQEIPESPGGSRNRRKDRVTFEVRDQRTHVSPETSPELRVEELSRGAERELTVELRPVGERAFAGEGGMEARTERPAAESGGFAGLLAEQLAGDLSPDIVKQAAIVLRDGGEGTIRLSLKPETLGKVKIHLEMAENKISGHIFVESEEALRAFEKEIHTLEQAFRDSGFTDASLDTALSGNGGGWKGEENVPFFSERFAASSYDSAAEPRAFSGTPGGGFSTVDLLV